MQQLEAQGWRLLDRNWHCRWGELDLVLERQQQLLVVEVKGRRSGHRDRHGLDAFHSAKPVSYTHLTLPTIAKV